MMKRLMIVALASLFVNACGDGGAFNNSTDSDNNLWDFSMVPSGFQKAASNEDLYDVQALAETVQMLGSKVALTNSMGELNDLRRLKKKARENKNPNAYAVVNEELTKALAPCKVEQYKEQVKNTTMISYNFIPEVVKEVVGDEKEIDSCMFHLSGSLKTSSSVLGPERTKGAPKVAAKTDGFTLTALEGYEGNIEMIQYSYSEESFDLIKTLRGETTRRESQTTLTTKIMFKSGLEVVVGIKKASGLNSTKASDTRADSSHTKDLRAGFKTSSSTVLYRDYKQEISGNETKTTEFKSINDLKIEEENNQN